MEKVRGGGTIMSISYLTLVDCDSCGYGFEIESDLAPNDCKAVTEARARGWILDEDGSDICAECAKKKGQESDER